MTCQGQIFEWRHLARGADTAEIYITCHWYDNNMDRWGAIFRSTDNGASLSIQKKYLYPNDIHEIFGDSTQGVIYQVPYGSGIGVSYDYGVTFEDKYIPITSDIFTAGGCLMGELYIEGEINIGDDLLYHVTHFGDSLSLVNTQNQ